MLITTRKYILNLSSKRRLFLNLYSKFTHFLQSRFDPSRYERLEDKKQNIAFVGWGAGRHPCIGMRFAKLEIKCITAMFLSGFDYDVVDDKDQVLYKLPEPSRNNT